MEEGPITPQELHPVLFTVGGGGATGPDIRDRSSVYWRTEPMNENCLQKIGRITELKSMKWDVYPGTYLSARNYDDPLQGACDSCICVAGLCSMAWTKTAFSDSPVVQKIGNFNYYTFKFWPGGQQKTVKVSERLCVDNTNLTFASSKQAGELWPALYEKAYAAFINAGRKDTVVDTFVMSTVPFDKNGSVTMQDLANKAFQDPLVSGIGDAYAYISAKCSNGKTKDGKPMIAWTAPGANVDGITANHTYSVLGVAANSYIVLRDPKRGAVEPTKNVLTNQTVDLGGTAIDLSDTTDGIFALDKSAFSARFYKLAFTP